MSDSEHEIRRKFRPLDDAFYGERMFWLDHPEIDPIAALDEASAPGAKPLPFNPNACPMCGGVDLVILEESPGRFINQCQTDWCRCRTPVPSEDEKRRHVAAKARMRRFNRSPSGSLQYLARQLGKSVRQVRRYCQLNLVPGAVCTPGGHWRVGRSKRLVAEVRRRIAHFRRNPVKHDRAPGILAANLAAAGRSLYLEEAAKELTHLDNPAAQRAATMKSEKTQLAVAAERLRMRGERVTREMLAREMGICRKTLFNRFTKREIQDVTKADVHVEGSKGHKTPSRL